MKAMLIFVAVVVCLCAVVEAQTGSVHCGVGCACSQASSPVCGTDNLTYLNECVLRCRKCELPSLERHYDGSCHDVIHFGHNYVENYPHTHLAAYPFGLRSDCIPAVRTVLPHHRAFEHAHGHIRAF